MKEYNHFFGVQFANDEDGMEMLMEWLNELGPVYGGVLFCMEATGLYCFPLTRFLATNSIDIWIEHPAQIKKATALARGKNDKVDSQRIVLYATKNLDRLRLWKPMDAT